MKRGAGKTDGALGSLPAMQGACIDNWAGGRNCSAPLHGISERGSFATEPPSASSDIAQNNLRHGLIYARMATLNNCMGKSQERLQLFGFPNILSQLPLFLDSRLSAARKIPTV